MSSIIDDLRNVFRQQNNVLIKLILINFIVFLSLILLKALLSFAPKGNEINELITNNFELGANLGVFLRKPWTLLTYCFTHAGFLHLLFNMLTLFWFGGIVQEFLGSRKLLNIYLLGGVFSGLFYILIYNLIGLTALNNISPSILGASAAIYAVMFAAVALVPEYEFYLFGIVLIKIKYLAWIFLLLSFMIPSSGISHVGGAILGYYYITLLRKGIDLGTPIETVSDWWSSFWKPSSTKKIKPRHFSKSTVSSQKTSTISLDPTYFPDQDEVDAILDKIGKSGYESLTKEEKQKLYRASQKKD